MAAKLTKSLIDATAATDREIILWDASLPGFGVRIKVSGQKSFVIQYRNRVGRSRRVTLGRYGTLTIDEARREARNELSRAARGRDPRQERQDDRASVTVAHLAERYMTDHCEGRCKESTMAAHRWLLTKFILPGLGRLTLTELRSGDIDQLHQSLKTTPYNANRVLGLLRAMLKRAEKWNLLPPRQNPAEGLKPFRERKRQRFLSIQELKDLARTIDQMERTGAIDIGTGNLVRLLIATGARLTEIRTLRWQNVLWDLRQIVLEEHKTDEHGAKVIPLNNAALAVLTRQRQFADGAFVFPGGRLGQPLVNVQKPWRRIRAAAGLGDVRIHDLRHSFASFAVATGASLLVIGGLLGHRSTAATSTYAHLSSDPLRMASDQIGQVVGPLLLSDESASAAVSLDESRRGR